MNIFEIKEEHKSAIVGFNGSGLPLGERSDLDVLAEMAHRNKNLAQYFVELPTMEAIKAYRAGEVVAAIEATGAEGSEQKAEEREEHPTEESAPDQVTETVEETPTESKRGKKGNNRA